MYRYRNKYNLNIYVYGFQIKTSLTFHNMKQLLTPTTRTVHVQYINTSTHNTLISQWREEEGEEKWEEFVVVFHHLESVPL